jgi:selenide,water dikinase
MDFTAARVEYAAALPDTSRTLLNDAQTSGGLLISLPAGRVGRLMEALERRGVEGAAVIGAVEAPREPSGAPIAIVRP